MYIVFLFSVNFFLIIRLSKDKIQLTSKTSDIVNAKAINQASTIPVIKDSFQEATNSEQFYIFI